MASTQKPKSGIRRDELEAYLGQTVWSAGLNLPGREIQVFVEKCLDEGSITATGGGLELLSDFDEAWK